MTALVARSPLHVQNLGMTNRAQAAANNGRRRSARNAFDDNNNDGGDAPPPAKKAKGGGGGDAAGMMVPVAKGGASAGSQAPSGASGTGKVTNGRVNGVARTRAKKSYDEDDDGFAFSRTRSKKSKTPATTATITEAQPAATKSTQPPKDQEPVAAPPKKKPRKALPTTPERDEADRTRRPRRSKRLSAENEEETRNAREPVAQTPPADTQAAPGLRTPAPTLVEVQKDESPVPEKAPASQKLHVDKKRRQTTTTTAIPLPWADTPVIIRNKELRKTSAEQHRRSSSGMRGKRASSLIETGNSNAAQDSTEEDMMEKKEEVDELGEAAVKEEHEDVYSTVPDILADFLPFLATAVPHSEVETGDFYKHISQDLTEPRRMRQLLVWCGHRALPGKPGGNLQPAEAQARHAARVIQDELLGEFSSKSDLSNWFDRQDAPQAVLIKQPNPRNVQNAVKLQELEAELARLREEKRSWDSLQAASSQPKKPENQPPEKLDLNPTTIDENLLDPSQAAILQTLLSSAPLPSSTSTSSSTNAAQPNNPDTSLIPNNDILNTTQTRLGAVTQSLEFKIDRFADALHRLEQYRQCGDRVAERLLAQSARALEERARARNKAEVEVEDGSGAAAESASVDAIDVLRALSRASNGPSSTSSSSSTSFPSSKGKGNGYGHGNGRTR